MSKVALADVSLPTLVAKSSASTAVTVVVHTRSEMAVGDVNSLKPAGQRLTQAEALSALVAMYVCPLVHTPQVRSEEAEGEVSCAVPLAHSCHAIHDV